MSRLFRLTFTFLAALFALAAIAMGFVSWKMAARPLSSQEMTPYIEAALARFVPGGSAKIEKSNLAWDNREHTLALDCEGLKIFGASGETVSYFPAVNLKIGVWSLLRGRLLPIEMKADNAQFWLTRRVDGQWMIGGAAATDGNAPSKTGADIFSVLQDVGDEIAHPLLSHDIEIKEAVWFVHDETIGKNWSLTAREITLRHKGKKAQGAARIEVAQAAHTSFLDAHYAYDRPEKLHRLDLSFQDINLAALASQHPKMAALSALDMKLTGRFSIGTDRDLNLSATLLKVKGDAGALKEDALWDKPVPAKSMDLSAHYDPEKTQIVLDNLSFDLNGTKLSLKGTASTPTGSSLWARPHSGGDFIAEVILENLPMDRFASVWPKPAVPGAREWISANMKRGTFDRGAVRLEGRIDWNDPARSELFSGDGKIAASHARVTYMDGMPAIDDVSAEGTFDLKHMDVKILGGRTGEIRLLPFTLSMTDFDSDTQYIEIPVRLTGPTPSILRLLDSKPLGYAKQIGLVPADAGGTAEGTLTLRFPMLDALLLKDVAYKAEAKFKDFALRGMIPHIDVSEGDLDFRLDDKGFGLQGPVALNKAPLFLKWKSRFDAAETGAPLHEAEVAGAIKEDGWAAFGLKGEIKTDGPTKIAVHYENGREGFSKLSVQADFKDAHLRVPALSLSKARFAPANLVLEAEIPAAENIQIKKIELKGKGLNVKGNAEVDPIVGVVRRAQFSPFIVARSNASIRYEDDPQNGISLTVSGKALDLSGLDEKEKGKKDAKEESAVAEEKRAKACKINLAKLYTSRKGFLADMSLDARRDKLGWKDVSFDAMAQGEVPVIASLKPEGKIYRFSAGADDFGKTLMGLGLTDTVQGGSFSVVGESAPSAPRLIVGKIKVGAFSVSGLPILARLLSAASPFGIIDMITGDAGFDHMRGYFKWQGDRLDLERVRAAGSVVGINIDGHIDMAQSRANLYGTLVPFSFFNSVIGSIPLLGDVITGGSGQGVIAAAYTVKGPTDNLDVSVNPVSLLTPGFLRNLFFSGDDGEKSEGKE